MSNSVLLRVTPVVASLLLHVAAYGAIAMIPKFTAVLERVLVADLVDPAAPPPPPPVAARRPALPERRPLTPPPPLETPQPEPVPMRTLMKPEPATPPPTPPPPPVVHESPAPAAATFPDATRPAAPIDAPPRTSGDVGVSAAAADKASPGAAPSHAPTVAPSAPVGPSAPGSAIAALPPDGITAAAVPRGGYQVRPSYPATARRLGIQGTTLLSVFVAADGRVGDVIVKESAGHPDLDHAAADAVRRWRFEPARRGSDPVAMWVLLPVEFRLR